METLELIIIAQCANVFKYSQLSKTYWQHENKNVSLMHISR